MPLHLPQMNRTNLGSIDSPFFSNVERRSSTIRCRYICGENNYITIPTNILIDDGFCCCCLRLHSISSYYLIKFLVKIKIIFFFFLETMPTLVSVEERKPIIVKINELSNLHYCFPFLRRNIYIPSTLTIRGKIDDLGKHLQCRITYHGKIVQKLHCLVNTYVSRSRGGSSS